MNDPQIDWVDRDEEFDDDEAEESSADLTLTEAKFDGLVVAPADWTIETLYTQIGKQIDLDPDFQRRNVWNAKAKSRFIESLLLGIPIPQILLSSKPGVKSSFLVLDGKQRLLTIKEFIDGKLPNGRKFRLKDLRVLKVFEGKTWEQMSADRDVAGKLLNETQRTTVLRGWTDESVLYEIFYRLNSGSVKLSPMELRMSLYPGEFLKFILRWTENIGPVHHLLKKRSPDPRMGDVELAVRYLAFTDLDIEYTGDLKKFLDSTCESYNIKFDDRDFVRSVEDRLAQLDAAIEAGINIFGESGFCRKYIKGNFESRFNRAIFDIMSFTLSIVEFRKWALSNGSALVDEFKRLSASDVDFSRSIETTTKSIESTSARFSKWIDAVSALSGIKLPQPSIK
ncbi:DUF262 domain-containing protein [Sphingopyxis sp. BSN-002]|uniref:DUF262 domain-containing protein n=1 Tax=Sphingopyxis sp. BSN-002 TaxID=2911495 RepID=UPI001EDB7BD8|nr:DUF262 domain-containing protein [Sphingopyxis sp. BSN-002]UKK84537.1 DUF262 domain-containing protein [Sphingopyxis sp. BSN-002]